MKILGYTNFNFVSISQITDYGEDKRNTFISNILERFSFDCLTPISSGFKEQYNQGFTKKFKEGYLDIFKIVLKTILKLQGPFSYLLIQPLTVDRKHRRSVLSNHEFLITEDNVIHGVLKVIAIITNIETNEEVDRVTIYQISLDQV